MHKDPVATVLMEDAELVVMNKPSGLLTIPDRFDSGLTSLKQILKKKYGEIFIVHRLDRDTSGIILFAKTDTVHRFYSIAFEERRVDKKYLGLVHGSPMQPSGTIDKPIAPHFTHKGKMMIHRSGKPSITHYKVLQNFGLYSLVEFNIETGRTHQIRVHMQDLGHPIVCDELYGTAEPILLSKLKRKYNMSRNQLEEKPLLSRLALHAHTLDFTTPADVQMHLEAELYRDMQATLTQLEKNMK